MSIFDKITERVGDIVDEVMLPDMVRRAHDEATRLIDEGEFEEAIEVLSRTLVAHPNTARTHFLIGRAHFQNEHYLAAVDALDRAAQIRETPSALFYAALALERLERFRDAQRYFHRAMTLGKNLPFQFDLEYGLGRVNRELGRNDKALRHFRRAIELWPEQFDVVAALADTLCDLNQFEEAERLLDEHSHVGDHAQAIMVSARLFEHHGDWTRANRAWQKALHVADERTKQNAAIGSVRTLIAMGEFQAATIDLDRQDDSTFTDTNRAAVAYYRGLAFQHGGNLQTAAAALDEARRIDPQNALANLARGRVALLQNEEGADVYFSRVLEQYGLIHAHECYFRLAQYYEKQGDFLTARQMYREAEVHDPDLGAQDHRAQLQYALGELALRFGDPAEAILNFRQSDHDDAVDGIDRALQMLRPTWDLPNTLETPDHVTQTLRALGTFLTSDSRLGTFIGAYQEISEVMNTPLSVAIVGEFNAGKSTVVNALIGEDVTPVGVVPTTAQQSVLQYGARKTARVVKTDGSVDETTFEDAKRLMKSNDDPIDRIEFTYPHPQLRVVNFWDTPGFNALNERHEEIARRALETAEAILWVMDANQVLSQTQLDRLETVKNSDERLIVIINKADRVPDAIPELIDYVEDHIGDSILSVFALSAKNAREGGDQGFDAFEAFFDQEIVQRAGRLKTIDARERLRILSLVLAAFQTGTLNLVERLNEELDSIASWIDEVSLRDPKQWAKSEVETLGDWSRLSLQAIESEIAESLKPVGTWSGKLALRDDDQEFLLALVSSRLNENLARSFQRVLRQLAQFEAELSNHVTSIVQSLPMQSGRAVSRRYESYFDETKKLKVLLDERVYGRLRAEGRGKLQAAGATALKAIEYAQIDRSAWRAPLRTLTPEFDDALRAAFEAWFADFFATTKQFCDRLHSELDLLYLESKHHLDSAPFVELCGSWDFVEEE